MAKETPILLTEGAFKSHLAGTIQVLLLLGELVKRQEGVAVAGGAVADPVAFSEQAPLPDDLSTVCGFLQVFLLFKHLARVGTKWTSAVNKVQTD